MSEGAIECIKLFIDLGLLITAITTARAGYRTMVASQRANEQARRDSIAQTRPYVFVEILPGLAGLSCYDIRITNTGKSSARQLRVDFSPWPEHEDDIVTSLRQMFETSRTLPPGDSIRSFWRIETNKSQNGQEMGMPKTGTLRVFYSSDDEVCPKYSERYEVLISNSGLWPVPEGGPNPDFSSDCKELRKFYLLGQAIARAIGNLAR